VTLRADIVKDGRRALLKARSVAARPLLDDGERGVTLQPVGGARSSSSNLIVATKGAVPSQLHAQYRAIVA